VLQCCSRARYAAVGAEISREGRLCAKQLAASQINQLLLVLLQNSLQTQLKGYHSLQCRSLASGLQLRAVLCVRVQCSIARNVDVLVYDAPGVGAS
jgi:hypothetical protein